MENNDTNTNCQCNNNYDTTTFMESFGKDDDSIRNCSSCPNFSCDGGMYMCKKFKTGV